MEVRDITKKGSPLLGRVMDSMVNNKCGKARHVVVQHNMCHREKLIQNK